MFFVMTKRVPTIIELAHAFTYVEHEFSLTDGIITSEMWAEGLSHGIRSFSKLEPFDVEQATQAFKQLTSSDWLVIAARADRIRLDNLMYADRNPLFDAR